MVQYEPLVIKIYKCIENVKTRWDNKKMIIVIVIVIVICCLHPYPPTSLRDIVGTFTDVTI